MIHIAIPIFFLLLTACSTLIIRDDDSTAVVVGKVAARTVIAIPTLGISEVTLVDLKDEERNSAWRKQELPQDEQACLREWREYVADHDRKILLEGLPQLMVSVVAQDYLGGSARMLDVPDLLTQRDAMQREWQNTLAREPQAALLSECSRRFALQRFFPGP